MTSATNTELTGRALLDDWRRRDGETNERHRCEAVFLVEATHYESHTLWVDWSEESKAHGWGDDRIPRISWEQISLGYGQTIGYLDKMPVHVSVSFARVHGQVIAFYEATSVVVDHRMVENWLKTEFPAAHGKTNPSNFHNCVSALERLRK